MPKSKIDASNGFENIYFNKWGIGATLFLPFLIAFLIISSIAFGLPNLFEGTQNPNSKIPESTSNLITSIAFLLFAIPIFLLFSWGMVFSVKHVSKNLKTAAKYRKIKLGTVIGAWLSALNKVHLVYTGFYVCLGIIWAIIAIITSFFVESPEILALQERVGPVGIFGVIIIAGIGGIAYISLFSLMVYLFVTLPLALISGVLFKLFAVRTSSPTL